MTCSRAGARHVMRDAVPPCELRYRGEAGTGRRNHPRRRPDRPRHPTRRSRSPDAPGGDSSGPSRPTPAPHRPQRPRAPHPGDALGRPRNSPPDEEDLPEQTVTTTFTLHAFKTTPEQHSRCVVLPDATVLGRKSPFSFVSMHLQVRGAP